MLIVTRKTNHTITIEPIAGLDPPTKFSEAFESSAIEIRLVHIGGSRVRVAIKAPPQFNIWHETHPSPVEGIDKLTIQSKEF